MEVSAIDKLYHFNDFVHDYSLHHACKFLFSAFQFNTIGPFGLNSDLHHYIQVKPIKPCR